MKTAVLFITVLLNALSIGFFFAWSVSVILGTQKVSDYSYLESMQSINRAILNPVFFMVFFGSLVALIIQTYFQLNNKPLFWLALASTILYLIGPFGITAFGNVPLNNALDTLNISQLNPLELKNFRTYYEGTWNHYHNIRTMLGLISFILLLIASCIQKTI
ncbi:anthrone oxygenase family protein [Algibacter mikhailovii]|uniref:Membrane protein n=1 Tax=Algibacter mikhailovii TaxID=425498 RepID=A0A918R1J2_9FLAO|nr:anthrone oxygenase family protein [Algibacter mikhailovii]GGZ82903.1 membrane protein [Algibacter mikhailovii]